jgi:hypothetical protein
MLELVVGAAVMCENKAVFIRNIFELNHASQAVLKGLVEQVLNRATDVDTEDDGTGGPPEEYGDAEQDSDVKHTSAANAESFSKDLNSSDVPTLSANLTETEQLRYFN